MRCGDESLSSYFVNEAMTSYFGSFFFAITQSFSLFKATSKFRLSPTLRPSVNESCGVC